MKKLILVVMVLLVSSFVFAAEQVRSSNEMDREFEIRNKQEEGEMEEMRMQVKHLTEMRDLLKKYKKESKGLLQVLTSKMNRSLVQEINTINQILKTGLVDEYKKEQLEIIKTNLYEFLDDASRIA